MNFIHHVNCTPVLEHFTVLLICTVIINIYAFTITYTAHV